MMRMDVPPSGKFWLVPITAKAISGISAIGVGPGRDQVVQVRDLIED